MGANEEYAANWAARKAARAEARRLIYPQPCCSTMKHQLDEGTIFDVLANEPFTTEPSAPLVYAQSDGGHGGLVAIQFCPFCGTRFAWRSTDGSAS